MEDARTEHARMERLPLDNFRSPTALARFVVPAVLGLLIDLWTKYWAAASLRRRCGVKQLLKRPSPPR